MKTDMTDSLKNPAPTWKTSSHVLKSTPSGHYKTLEIAYIWNYFENLERPRQLQKHDSY